MTNRKPTGRPTDYNDELAEEICSRVIMRPIHQVAKDADMPSESAIYLWLQKYPAFMERYTRAREIRAYRRAESADQVTEDMRAGKIDAAQARVELDKIRWQAGRENSRVFSEKHQVEHSGHINALSDDQIRQRYAELIEKAKAASGGTSDG